jgi:glycosyltransferase involved in cell wall biosynthesis
LIRAVTSERTGRPYLSIIIPAYNEELRLRETLSRIHDYIRDRKIHAEILVIDDGSRDGTRKVGEEFLNGRSGRVISYRENRGKGYAVRRGISEAVGSWVLMTDADLSAPIEEYEKLATAVREADLDIAIGSRALEGSRVEVRQNFLRELMGKTFNRIIRMTTGLPFRDTQCGFKLMDRQRVKPLFERMVVDRFAFDVELLYLCRRLGLSVREVPVVWRNDSNSHVSLLTDPLRMLLDVGRVRWRFRRGRYDPSASAGAVDR